MRIIFAGTPANAAATLETLIFSGHEIVAVLTRQDAPIGRKRILTPSAVAVVAEKRGLRLIKANKIDDSVNEELEGLRADLGIVVAFGALFKRRTLDCTARGWLNLHYSLLPKWRGAAPVQHSILAGEAETGVSLFWLDEGMDTGPLAMTVKTEIEPGQSAGELLQRLTTLGSSALSELLPMVEAGLDVRQPQPTEGATVAPKILRDDARISWEKSAIQVENLVQAMNPEPMAWCDYSGSPLRVLDAIALGATDWSSLENEQQEPGTMVLRDSRVLVTCLSGTLLELKSVQPSGKLPMAAADWARGLKDNWRLA